MPYDIETPLLWEELYRTRCEVGSDRQPLLANYLNILNTTINSKGFLTSFDSLDKVYHELISACQHFDPAGQWYTAQSRDSTTFYRLEGCSSFIRRHLNLFRSVMNGGWGIDSGLPNDAKDISETDTNVIFKRIIQKYELFSQDWLPLDKIVNTYNGRRSISWWTTGFSETSGFKKPDVFIGDHLTEEHQWLIEFAHNVGIVNHWLSEQMFLLRVQTNSISEEDIAVPSIIDAFDQPIFDPVSASPIPKYGKAIRIGHTLEHGYDEYVLKKIPTDKISLIPIRINKDQLRNIYPYGQLNDNLVQLLINWIKEP